MFQKIATAVLIIGGLLFAIGYLPGLEIGQAKARAKTIAQSRWTASADSRTLPSGEILVEIETGQQAKESLLVPVGHHFKEEFAKIKQGAMFGFLSCQCSQANVAAAFLAPDVPQVRKVLQARAEAVPGL